MKIIHLVYSIALLSQHAYGFVPAHNHMTKTPMTLSMSHHQESLTSTTRQGFMKSLVSGVSALVVASKTANADVYSGNTLPPGMQQFSRALKLRKNLQVSTISFEL
jgi:hypothetical protein